MASEAGVAIARTVRQNLAGSALTGGQAKLYSQRLRRDMGRPGLASFREGDVDSYIDEAMLLLECALLERGELPESDWRGGVKRAGEILEWLSQANLKPLGAPLHLLSGAAYQVAGYPAMALGHLRRVSDIEPISRLLKSLFEADFPATLEQVRIYWRNERSNQISAPIDPTDLTLATFRHVIMCIGSVCAYLRTGVGDSAERALAKLESLAASVLYSRDPYSYLLARLTAVACRNFTETSLWPQIDRLRASSSEAAGPPLIQFARSAFTNRRTLVWPTQVVGISQLCANTSFVLCTPTGSGKTSVATLAIVQGLFSESTSDSEASTIPKTGNLALYLVPSRALAAEVESRLALDLKCVAADPVVVTGLYGGVDWGPTDAWVQTERSTIVICTFEKADALLRYLGVLFLDRVRLVIIDEAHMVEHDGLRPEGLVDGSSRAFRLEQLGSRLLSAKTKYGFRLLALSAVAARSAPALARWVGGSEAMPHASSYRSTRQMLGRLVVNTDGSYAIRYDLMDGRSLKFDDEQQADSPFVLSPFPSPPGAADSSEGPEVRMRRPTLWAALHLAAERADGTKPSVLISLSQGIDSFAVTCADLMDSWASLELPNYQPVSSSSNELWTRCLASAADYFTKESVEYRLMQKGIAVHHGKMPGVLARRLKLVIDRGLVRVIIATSTLSEGVNLPVNYLLVPSLYRAQGALSLQEFTNLIGRAGRPGVATEGSALVVLSERTYERKRSGEILPKWDRQWNAYENLITQIEQTTNAAAAGSPEDHGSSPLAQLLISLEAAWQAIAVGGNQADFYGWLEQTAIINTPAPLGPAFGLLDSLDGFLIAAIHEIEELRENDLTQPEMEEELIRIWRQTYAYAVSQEEARLSRIWLTRGRTTKERYPDAALRRRLYRTSLSPRSASILLSFAEEVRVKLADGIGYGFWEPEERFQFIREVLALLSRVPSFQIEKTLGRKKNFDDWPKLLRWWLGQAGPNQKPKPKEITTWFQFVAQNFIYRGAWGLGSIIGLLLDNTEDGVPIRALEIGDWPLSGLPWAAFWLKELITWGTLDPIAALLLARGDALDRPQAEEQARDYYTELEPGTDANDALDPRRVSEWVDARRPRPPATNTVREFSVGAVLARPELDYKQARMTVAPLEADGILTWIDPAGYTVASSPKPDQWPDQPSSFDFELSVASATIKGEAYLRYA